MPIKLIKSKTASVSAADLLQTFQKDYGEAVGGFGGALVETGRIPTGLFPLDLALAGGFPRGRCSIIYGPESSSKTNTALLAIAQHQKLWPELICTFFDLENSFDPAWAKLLGVDTDRLIVIRPDYGEQMVDMVEAIMHTDDCGLVVIDSLAAVMTANESESSADKAVVGGGGIVIGKLVRKTNLALIAADKAGRKPSLFYINQIRMKIGVMFGNPETTSGGNAPKFQSALTLRVYGKNILDPKVNAVMPILKETNFVVQKWKVPLLAISGQFSMVTYPHKGLAVGQCDDFNTVSEYLKTWGAFEKGPKGKGWVILGETYDTIQPFKDRLYGDPEFGREVRHQIISRLLSESELSESGGG